MRDDFFIMSADFKKCASHLGVLIALCEDLGVQLAPDKTTNSSRNTTFLGIELDTSLQIAKLPLDKLHEYTAEVRSLSVLHKIRRKDLESLIGKLNFAASVVPARPFLRRLIDLLHSVKKPYHFIRVTNSVKQDLLTWLAFLEQYNGVTYFRSLKIADSESIHMVSDASKQGFGVLWLKMVTGAVLPFLA